LPATMETRIAPPSSRSLPRRVAFPALAAVLAAGAPIGLLVVRWADRGPGAGGLARSVAEDLPTFVYVTVSTLVIFCAFGYAIGRQADALAELSVSDPLTGLLNHRGFTESLEEEVARTRRYRAPLSLLMADVDGLKAINDREGHAAGDRALRLVAGALAGDARGTDSVARIGGDEFALIAPHTDAADAFALAERIRSLVAGQGQPDAITISVGVATADPGQTAAGALFRAADAALYAAKRRGRDRVAAAGPDGA
jgi:diguanylate cyclase (GGDEF)-like protein